MAVTLNEPCGRETSEHLATFNRLVASNLLEAEFRSAVSGLSFVTLDRKQKDLAEVLGFETGP